MAKAHFLLSTGRVSTQAIARAITAARPEAIVEHESLGPHFASRRVFRQPDRFEKVMANNPKIAAKWDDIEHHLDSGRDYFELGWTAFGWVPYLAKRFDGRFKFAHVVRNPFFTAASHSTHLLFRRQGKDTAYQKRSVLHPGDPGIVTPNYWGDASPSAFEWALFQWLEINQFGQELSDLSGFIGRWQFEDIHGPIASDFMSKFCGADVPEIAKFDRVQGTNVSEIGKIHPELLIEVVACATRFGYHEPDVLNAFNASELSKLYTRPRITQRS